MQHGILTPAARAKLEKQLEDAFYGGDMETAGRIAKQIRASNAAPLRYMVKGAQGLQGLFPRFSAAVPATSSVISNASIAAPYAGLTTPGSPGERASHAGTAGLFSAGGDIGMRGLARMVGGPFAASRVTPHARRLIDEGVPVPPWKATDSAILRDLAERAQVSPFARSVIGPAEERAIRAWNSNLAKAATPPSPVMDDAGNILRWNPAAQDQVKDVGSSALLKLRGRFDAAYDALYRGRVIPVDVQFRTELGETLKATERYHPHLAAEVRGVATKVRDILSPTDMKKTPSQKLVQGHEGATPGAVKQALDAVEDAIGSAWRVGNAEKAEALGGIKTALLEMRHRGLPSEVQSMKAPIDAAYRNFKVLERATSLKAAQKAGMVSPDQVLGAMRALDRSPGKAAFARSTIPGQEATLNAERVLGSRLPPVGPGTAERLYGAALMGVGAPVAAMSDLMTGGLVTAATSPLGQRWMFGQWSPLRAAGETIRKGAPYAAQGAGILAP